MDFNDGAPEQPTQPQATDPFEGWSAEERLMFEQYQRDPDFRRGAVQARHVMQAGQYYQPQQTQESHPHQQESELDRVQARIGEVERRMAEMRLITYRDATPAETEEWRRLEAELLVLENKATKLAANEALRLQRETSQQLAQQQQVGQFQQAVGQRFAQFAQAKLNPLDRTRAEKEALYQKLWGVFTSHPFYPQIMDVQAADELMKIAWNDLVANHGAPRQRNLGANSQNSAATGRTDERYNDVDSPQREGAKDRFSHLPPEVAGPLRERFGSRPVTN